MQKMFFGAGVAALFAAFMYLWANYGAGAGEYITAKTVICNTPAQAEEVARAGQSGFKIAVFAINKRTDSNACGLAIIRFLQHTTVAKVVAQNKLIFVERVEILIGVNPVTLLWQPPLPDQAVQFMLTIPPGINI